MNVRLYLAQRASAAILVPLVIVHIITILIATRNGLTGAEILERTQGNFGWAVFYTVFVVAIAIHSSIGLRSVAMEWLKLRGQVLDVLAIGYAVLIIGLGMRAVLAVFG